MGFFEIFKNVGSVVGILITLITFFGLISAKPKKAFKKMIREEAEAANESIEEKLKDITKRLDEVDQNDLVLIRNTITHIYFKYKDDKKIPQYEKQNVLYLYERYEKLNGNSYVKEIVQTIKGWDEIV